MSRLTKRQIEILQTLDAGRARVNCQLRSLNKLQDMGLIKLYVPVGWAITAEGHHALTTGKVGEMTCLI